MADNPASLNEMSRRDLAELARSLGVPDAEVMTRAELRAAIENSRTAPRPAHAGRPTTWLGVARGLIASIVEQGLNLPDAAALIRGRAPLSTPKPPPPVATVTLARIYAAQGHIQRAISTLAEVLRTDPDHEIARALRDDLMGRSGLRDSGLRDSNTRDIGQREPGVHENGVHENGLRENGLREMSAEESRTPTPTRSTTEEAPSADSAPDTERPAPPPSGEGESPSAAPATIVAEPPRSLGAAIPASEAATPMSSAPATIQTEPPAPVSDEPASPWVAHDAEPAASAAEAAAPSAVEPSVEPSARTLQDPPLQRTAPGVPSEVASDPRAAREPEGPAVDALPFEPSAGPSSAAFEGPPSGPEASASAPASAPSRRQRALAPAPTPASVVVLATAGTPRYVYWELPGEGGNGSVAAEHELLLVAHVPSAGGALRHERRERIHARSGALRVSGLPEGAVLRALLVHAPSGAAARPIGVAGVVRLDETESDVQSVAFCPSRLSNPADLAIVALDHLASARVLEW